MATAFNSQGSTPTLGQSAFGTPTALNSFVSGLNTSPSTPQARALTNMSVGGTQTTTPQVIMPQAPSQPVVSHTVSDAAGNTVTQKYATPEPGLLASQNGNGSISTPTQSTAPVANAQEYNNQLAQSLLTPSSSSAVPQLSNAGVSTAPTGTNTANGSLTQQGLLSTLPTSNTVDPLTEEYQSQIAALNTNFANEEAGINNLPTTLNEQTGRLAAIQNEYNQAESNISSAYQSGLTARGQNIEATENAAGQLSPQNQAITPPAGGVTTIANTGAQYSNPIYEPASGAYNALSPQPNGTPGQPSTAGQASQYTIKSGDTLDNIAAANGTTEAALLAANPNITNPNNIQAGASLTIPAASGNTAFSGGVAAGNAALGTQYAQNYSAYQQSTGIKNNIESIIQNNPQLNPSQFTNVNSALQFLNGQVSNPAYTILANNIAEYVNTLAPILGVGGDTTNYKTELAQQFVNGAANGQNLQQILNGIDQTASVKLAQQKTAGSSTGTVTPTTPTGGSGGSNIAQSFTWNP